MTDMGSVTEPTPTCDLLVIGAGMAGLTAAARVRRAGHAVVVVDKGRGVGGRLATRRVGQATFDHGAQFMTAREPRFAAAVADWLDRGIAREWYRTHPGSSGEHPRWRGAPGMTALAKDLALDLDVALGRRVVAVRRDAQGWTADLEGGGALVAGAVLLTPPVPQSLALLHAGAVELPAALATRLGAIEYECCLAVMAVLDGPSRIPPPGGLALEEGPIAWLADNQVKGVSAQPAVTLHASGAFSRDHWEDDRRSCADHLLREALPYLGGNAAEVQVHGWRYSKPVRVDASPCAVLNSSPPLVIAGDAFAGPRVEGAALSGWAAVDALLQLGLGPNEKGVR